MSLLGFFTRFLESKSLEPSPDDNGQGGQMFSNIVLPRSDGSEHFVEH